MARFDLNKTIPILILGDSPDGVSGLSRICHDVAWLISSLPEFRLGVLGRAGLGRSYFPWTSYQFGPHEQWGEGRIMEAWNDLSQGQKGVVLTVWDASRLMWFSDPLGMPNDFQQWLASGAIERWGLFMQDCEGVLGGKLPLTAAHVMAKFDRVLLASKWAYGITKNTIEGHPDIDWLPHPLHTDRFSPQDRMASRSHWGIGEKEVLIGCVMANQARKYWPVVFEALALMRPTTAGLPKLWAHTDRVRTEPVGGYWNLEALVYEYGLQDRVILDTAKLSDRDMALRYSACDATVLISGCEGFAYPIVESLGCGVPCVSGKYGAGGDLVSHGVMPSGYRIETMHNSKWACYEAKTVAQALERATDQVRSGDWESSWGQEQVAHLNGSNIGRLYQRWFRKGLQ
jgi:hypothetical protein